MSMSQLTQEKTGSESHLESQIHGNKNPTTLAQIEETAFEDLNIESLLTPEEIRKLKWKLDARVLVPCFILYFLSTLDRATLGSAATFGFRTDNHLVANQYNTGVSIFFVFYGLSMIPSNLILKRVQAKIWLPVLALGYGVTSLGTTWINSYGHFIAVRIVLAISEAGTLPGVMFFLSLWYSRDELSFRIPFGLAASAMANGVAPFLTNAYVKMGPITSAIHSWRSAFFVNAIVTLGFAVIAFFWLPWDPEKDSFLTDAERTYLLARSKKLTAGKKGVEQTTWKSGWHCFQNPIIYCQSLIIFCATIVVIVQSFFLSLVLQQEFHLTGTQSNSRTGAVFFVAVFAQISIGLICDKTRIHAPFVLLLTVLSLIGTIMFLFCTSARYGGAFLTALGGLTTAGISQAWATPNFAPYTSRAVASGFWSAVGTLGGIVGAWIFPPTQAKAGYPSGKGISITFAIISILAVCVQWWYCVWENKQRDLGKRDWRLEGITKEEEELLGSLHPHFRFQC